MLLASVILIWIKGNQVFLTQKDLLRIKLDSFNNINVQVIEILIKEIKVYRTINEKAII